MLEERVIELLESGCGLIVGLVTADGRPLAARGWGLALAEGSQRGRVLVGARDLETLGHGWEATIGTWTAVTGANVLTLHSVQLKGPITGIEPADEADLERSTRYCDDFFHDVAVVDSIPRVFMERLVPAELVACDFEVVEAYDQTPGPGAGSQLAERRRAR
jgi:hypothetical protein